MQESLTIQSHRGPYQVRFGRLFEGLEAGLGEREHLLIDERVAQLYAQPLARALAGRSVLRIQASEANKSLEEFPRYVLRLIERGIKRDHRLVVVGGGIIQDVAAFIAATLLRGLAWRFYPTTLLAQADSCIGSKSSVNVGGYKNQLGTFTPPDEILIATDVLRTLDEGAVRSGIGEMLKVHIIAGWDDARRIAADYPALAADETVLLRTLRRSLEIKQAKIELDEFDRNERLVMNYGHSFGHAIESATDYAVPHGIAVTIGMDLANFLSWQLGLIERGVFEALHRMLEPNYRGFEAAAIPRERFFAALAKDKKNQGAELRLVLMRGPGQVFLGTFASDARLRGSCEAFLDAMAAGEVFAEC